VKWFWKKSAKHVDTRRRRDLLVFPEDRGQPANLGAKSCSHMLRLVRNKLFNAGHDLAEERIALEQSAEAWDYRQ
jgi:hypothetical protein